MASTKPKRSLTTRERRRLIANVQRNATVEGVLVANWIRAATNAAGKMRSGSAATLAPFWIKLFGVLHDISDLVDDRIKSSPTRSLVPIRKAIDAILSCFSNDDLIYLQYRRHHECHPLQHAYQLRERKGVLEEMVRQRLAKTDLSVDDTDAAIVRVLKRYPDGEVALARDFANRSYVPLQKLSLVSIAYFGLPD